MRVHLSLTSTAAAAVWCVAKYRYLHGPNTSEWGARRARDLHQEPYNKVFFEIGNEQDLTDDLLSDVLRIASAMQSRAEVLKLNFNLSLAVGGRGWATADVAKFAKAIDSDAHAGTDKVAWYYDFHIGGDSTDTTGDWRLLTAARATLAEAGSKIRGVVFEENGALHGLNRALGHAARSNRLHCIGDFVRHVCCSFAGCVAARLCGCSRHTFRCIRRKPAMPPHLN